MEDGHWMRVRPALEALLWLEPEERHAHWRDLERQDPELARELSALLRLEEGAEDTLEPPTGLGLPWLRPSGPGEGAEDREPRDRR